MNYAVHVIVALVALFVGFAFGFTVGTDRAYWTRELPMTIRQVQDEASGRLSLLERDVFELQHRTEWLKAK